VQLQKLTIKGSSKVNRLLQAGGANRNGKTSTQLGRANGDRDGVAGFGHVSH